MTISTYLPEHQLADIVCETVTDHTVSLYCSLDCDLAEGPLWHAKRNSLLWLDILNNRLYEKCWAADFVSYWQLPSTASSMALDGANDARIWLITADALAVFHLNSGEYQVKTPFSFPQGYRTNDGAVSPDGRYWFGTMLRQPKAGCGAVYSIGPKADLRLEIENIAIPNTFCWQNQGKVLLVTDSLEQVTRRFDIVLGSQHFSAGNSWFDLSSTDQTPDGAAADNMNNIWLAVWGGRKLICLSNEGQKLTELKVPVLQPSSCCFGGPDNNLLFITSAKQGLTDSQLVQYPDSGKIFVFKTAVQGAPVHAFRMD